jgi:hypothetical protein
LNFAAPTDFSGQDMVDYLPTATAQMNDIVNKYDGSDLSITNLEVVKQSLFGMGGVIFDANIKIPYTFQVNAGMQREIASGLSLSVDYIMIRSISFGAADRFSVDLNRWKGILR